jgi:hypothetical protein
MGAVVSTSPSVMNFSVGPGSDPVSVAVGSRSGADGATKFVVPTGTVTTTAAPSSGSRIDVVWARQLDPDKGDPSNQSVLGVTQGGASASPSQPAIPTGAVILAVYQIPSGITRTSQATLIARGDYAIPYGASLGVLHRFVDTQSGLVTQGRVTLGAATIKLPTPRTVAISIAPTVATLDVDADGVALYRILVNGAEAFASHYHYLGRYSTGYMVYVVDLPAGNTTIAYTREHITGDLMYQRHGVFSGRQYPGTTLLVEDRGVD